MHLHYLFLEVQIVTWFLADVNKEEGGDFCFVCSSLPGRSTIVNDRGNLVFCCVSTAEPFQ